MFKIGESYISLRDKIQSMTFTSPTSVSVWWHNGQVGHYVGTEVEIKGIRDMLDILHQVEDKMDQEHLEKLRDIGPYYQEMERAKAQEDLEDYRKQRQALRNEGIYGHAEYIGCRYHYQIERDGKQFESGSLTITAEDIAGKSDRP